MKKIAIFLLLLCGPVRAEWTGVGESDAVTSYADPASIVRDGNHARMWSLRDHKDFQRMVEIGYFSQKSRIEYDCVESRSRVLGLFLHAKKMGVGKVIYDDTLPHEWEPVTPDTMSEVLRKFACR